VRTLEVCSGTAFAIEFYQILAEESSADLPEGFSGARLKVEMKRKEEDDPLMNEALSTWAVPLLYLRSAVTPLYDGETELTEFRPVHEAEFVEDLCIPRVSAFVGRRQAKRLILKTLSEEQRSGLVLRGISGVGKSSLAEEVFCRLAEGGWMLFSMTGLVSVEAILDEFTHRLHRLFSKNSAVRKVYLQRAFI
jgi:hypothetical protein